MHNRLYYIMVKNIRHKCTSIVFTIEEVEILNRVSRDLHISRSALIKQTIFPILEKNSKAVRGTK